MLTVEDHALARIVLCQRIGAVGLTFGGDMGVVHWFAEVVRPRSRLACACRMEWQIAVAPVAARRSHRAVV